MNLKNLAIRALSGTIYAGSIIGCIFWGYLPFNILMAIFGVLGVIEYDRLCGNKISSRSFLPALILDILGIVALSFTFFIEPFFIWIFIMICRLVMELYIRQDNAINCLAHSLSSQIYIGIPIACVMGIASIWNLHIILAIFLMIWISDTGAYITGSLFGKHRLFERISPKKSWEGFIGGLGFNLLAGWLFCIGGSRFWNTGWSVGIWLFFAALITIFSTWGDLIESLMKRSRNVKDSGNLIPGHGGILDRIDSLLLVMPACFLFMYGVSLYF